MGSASAGLSGSCRGGDLRAYAFGVDVLLDLAAREAAVSRLRLGAVRRCVVSTGASSESMLGGNESDAAGLVAKVDRMCVQLLKSVDVVAHVLLWLKVES